jgi:hypothetical protein
MQILDRLWKGQCIANKIDESGKGKFGSHLDGPWSAVPPAVMLQRARLLGPVSPHQSGQGRRVSTGLQEGTGEREPENKGLFFFSRRCLGGRRGAAAGAGYLCCGRWKLRYLAALRNMDSRRAIDQSAEMFGRLAREHWRGMNLRHGWIWRRGVEVSCY